MDNPIKSIKFVRRPLDIKKFNFFAEISSGAGSIYHYAIIVKDTSNTYYIIHNTNPNNLVSNRIKVIAKKKEKYAINHYDENDQIQNPKFEETYTVFEERRKEHFTKQLTVQDIKNAAKSKDQIYNVFSNNCIHAINRVKTYLNTQLQSTKHELQLTNLTWLQYIITLASYCSTFQQKLTKYYKTSALEEITLPDDQSPFLKQILQKALSLLQKLKQLKNNLHFPDDLQNDKCEIIAQLTSDQGKQEVYEAICVDSKYDHSYDYFFGFLGNLSAQADKIKLSDVFWQGLSTIVLIGCLYKFGPWVGFITLILLLIYFYQIAVDRKISEKLKALKMFVQMLPLIAVLVPIVFKFSMPICVHWALTYLIGFLQSYFEKICDNNHTKSDFLYLVGLVGGSFVGVYYGISGLAAAGAAIVCGAIGVAAGTLVKFGLRFCKFIQ